MRRLVPLLTVAAALWAAAGARAQGIDQTCVLPLTKFDAATVNVAYPDEAAVYYVGNYQAAPGTRIRMTGVFPHARYMSFNVYDNAQRPLDALADVQIAPDPGSTNPFPAGADRTAKKRAYNAFISFDPIPATRAPNTLYTGTGQNGAPNFQGTFIYRVYVPDKGLNETGGVPLPTVTLESSANGAPPPRSACDEFAKPSGSGINEQVSQTNGLPQPPPSEFPGVDPPVWHKFVNLPIAGGDLLFENPYADPARKPLDQIPAGNAGGSGGFLSNIHNAYLYANVNRHYGEVLFTRLRAPTFADTRPGPAVMPDAQLRYFSMCQNESFSQRFIACRTDDQSTVGSDGFLTYVISTPAQRPANATAACGVTWIPWGPSVEGVLIYRNMLPTPSFGQAIQRVPERGKEAAVMGDYYPASKYYADKAAFEKLGCHVAAAPGTFIQPPARRCASRRSFRIRLLRNRPHVRLRSARVYVNGRRVKTLRGRRITAPVILRGLPKGRFTVRIVAITRSGKRLVSIRRYRTCTPRRRT